MAKKDIIKHKKGEVIYEAKIEAQKPEFKVDKIVLATVLFIIVLLAILFL